MVSEIDINKYEFVSKEYEGMSIFHSVEWINVLADYYHFPKKIIHFHENGVSLSLIPFLVSTTLKGKKCLNFLPFTDQIDILGKNHINHIIKYLSENELSDYYKIIFHTDISNFVVDNEIKNKIFIDDSYVKHTLFLSSLWENIQYKFSINAKRNIKKAIKNQVEIRYETDDNALAVFYHLHLLTRKKHGTPIQPYGFFKKLKQVFLEKENGMILSAYKGKIPLAAAVFLFDNQTMIYKYGASNPNFLKFRPNELLFSEAIRIAQEKNLKVFDFGISKINNIGLRHFKSGFGAVESPVSYSVMSNKPIKKKGKTGDNRVIKFIIRHSPLWVNRLIGELFYKFAA